MVLAAQQMLCDNNGCASPGDVFVLKLAPAGSAMWSAAYGDEDAQGVSAVACDSAGHIVITGNFRGELDFATPNALDGTGPAGVSQGVLAAQKCDGYLAQLDADGAHLWSRSFGSGHPTCQRPAALAMADDDAVVLAGGYYGPVTLSGDNADKLPSADSAEVLLARFSSNGEHLFSRGYASTSNQYASGVALGPSWDIFMVGSFGKQVNFEPDNPDAALVSAGSGDMFLAQLRADGDYVTSRRYGDNFEQLGTSIVVDEQGRIARRYFRENHRFWR
jgi:hypothetical protein